MRAIKPFRPAALAIALLPFAIACSNGSHEAASADMAASEGAAAPASAPVAEEAMAMSRMDDQHAPAPARAEPRQAGVDAAQVASAVGVSNDASRRFVLSADARFQVEDVYAAATRIEDMAQSAGGFIIANRISADSGRLHTRRLGDGTLLELTEYTTSGEVTVRVPAERTQAFLRSLTELMQFLDTRNFEARDMQFELLRRQLTWARNQLLQQEISRAGTQPGYTGEKIDAALSREQALRQRDEAQISQRELDDAIAFSTLRLSLYQPSEMRSQVLPDPDAIVQRSGPGFFQRIGIALASGWRGLLDVLVAMAAVWPLWLLIGVVVATALAWRRRRDAVHLQRMPATPAAMPNQGDNDARE